MVSELDGAIGDGDHGINMGKGSTLYAKRLVENSGGFTDGLAPLGRVLLSEIGGAMDSPRQHEGRRKEYGGRAGPELPIQNETHCHRL